MNIEKVNVLDANTMKKVAETKLDNHVISVRDHRGGQTRDYKVRKFSIVGLTSNHEYIVMLDRAWRTNPERISFSCPDMHGRFKFGVDLLFHSGNRLGG